VKKTYRIEFSDELNLDKKLSLIRKILRRSSMECIIVSTSNARSLGQILSVYKQQVKAVEIIVNCSGNSSGDKVK